MSWGVRCIALLISLSLLPRTAVAHDVGATEVAAPLPLNALLLGAAVTVGATALWLTIARRGRSIQMTQVELLRIRAPPANMLQAILRLAFLGVVLLAMVLGVTGRQVAAENFATLFTWPVWFRGLALLAILAGSPWLLLSPWRTIYAGLKRLEGQGIALVGNYPAWLSDWPAVTGFLLLFGVLDILTTVPLSPRLTTATLALYATIMMAGALMFGRTWLHRADPLHVFYRVLGRTAILQFRATDDGEFALSVRAPWQGTLRPVETLAGVVFVIATLYTVSFDGFANTRLFSWILDDLGQAVGRRLWGSLILYMTGLLGFIVSFGSVAWVIEQAAQGSDGCWQGAVRRFGPTLVPIAAAYELAHNYPYILRNLGQILTRAVRIFGVDGISVQLTGWLSLPIFWGSQVILIVLGHVVAVIGAHYVAVDRYQNVADARRGHMPLVVLMVGYTILSLWIISQPVVQ